MATKFTLRMTQDTLPELRDAIQRLATLEVLVGFPEDSTDRQADEDDDSGITNAALAYIHDTGMPEQNIPARPFMHPGIMSVRGPIADGLMRAAKSVLKKGGPVGVEVHLNRVGTIAELGIKKMINSGVPPPLSEHTLRDRARRGRKGAKQELANRAAGLSPSTALAKPLVDTAQMRNAVKYVVTTRNRRRA